MSSNEVAYALQVVKLTAGRIAKHALLSVLREDHPELSKKVMQAVFNKDVTYGFAKNIPAPTRSPKRPRQFTDQTWNLLDQLAARSLTGDAARTAVAKELGLLSGPSQELLIAILQQNLRGGYGIDVVVDVWGPIVETFDVCLAQDWRKESEKIAASIEEFDPKVHRGYYPVWVDIKYDGLRGFIFTDDPILYSRKRLPQAYPESLAKLAQEFLAAVDVYLGPEPGSGFLLDCEIVAMDGTFQTATSNARSTKKGAAEGSLKLAVIDVLTREELVSGQSRHVHARRRQGLEDMMSDPAFQRFAPFIELTEGRACKNEQEVAAFAAESWERGLEGLIIKLSHFPWEGKRSYGWLKYKGKGSIKGRIIGYELADPLSKNAGKVGSVKYELESGVRGKVAGMTDKMRNDITANQEHYLGEQIEMEFHELTPDGVLRHPRVKAIRTDRE